MSRQLVKENIPVGGVWAYTRGQSVEADVVEANGWQDYVVGDNTKEAREIKAEITGRPVEEFETAKSSSSGGTKSSRAAAQTEPQEG